MNIHPYAMAKGGTLSAEMADETPSTYVGPVLLRHGGDIHISGTWEGTLALQRYWETLGAWKTEKSWTANPTEGQVVDTLTLDVWRIGFTAYTSGDAIVGIKSRSNH